jgi:hypothetical protein
MQITREEQVLSTFQPSEEQGVAAFNHAAEERRFLRGQQWQVTNYTLIAYAALAVAPTWLEPDSWRSWASWGAFGLALLAAGQALRILANLEWQLNRERRRLRAVRDRLLLMREIQHSLKNPAMWWQRRFWVRTYEQGTTPRDLRLKPSFFAVVFLGFIVASLIILSRIPCVQQVVARISQSASAGSWPAS